MLLAEITAENYCSKNFLNFLDHLSVQIHCNKFFKGKKVLLFLDNATYHHTDEVKKCMRAM
jgi:hypothetical protein